jgi:short-subunit dehydrogenase
MTDTKLALITGASSGIGFGLAKLFAPAGYDLVVTAENDGIRDVPQRLAEFSADVEPIQVDLRMSDGVEHLYQSAIEGGRTLAAAALNAGVGQGDMFLKTELADDMGIIDLNVRSTVHLAKLVVRDMANREVGRLEAHGDFRRRSSRQRQGRRQPVADFSAPSLTRRRRPRNGS